MKKIAFFLFMPCLMPLFATKNSTKSRRPSLVVVETPKALFQIPITKQTTALDIKKELMLLQGTTVKEQRLNKQRSSWFLGLKKRSSELKNHERILKKGTKACRLSLSMTPKKEINHR